MIYCIKTWGNASNCHLDQLYIIQKKVTRFLFRLPILETEGKMDIGL